MHACEHCGIPVRYVLLQEKRGVQARVWSAPLEAVEREVQELGDGLIVTETFVPHQCPTRLEIERQNAIIRAKLHEEAVAALALPCPRCGVDSDQQCENLTERARGNRVHTVNMHSARLEAAGSPMIEGFGR